MADEAKRLWGWEKCDSSPDNAYRLISEWYCVDGYGPDDQGKQCILITEHYESGAKEYSPDGLGKHRYLFDDGTIDRSFNMSRFKSLYINSPTWADVSLPKVADRLRAATGHFWSSTYNETDVQQVRDQLISGGSTPPISYDSWNVGMRFDPTKPHAFKPNKDSKIFSGDDGPDNFIATMESYINEDVWFEDLSFQVTSPFSKSVYDILAHAPGGSKYADISTSYNTYLPKYEELLTTGVDERLLPNMYAFKTIEMRGRAGWSPQSDPSATITKRHITLDRQIESPNDMREVPSWKYFNSWVDKYPTTDAVVTSDLSEHYSNIIISHESASDLKAYNKKKSLYPMYFNIKFSTSRDTEFSELLKETNMSALFMNLIVDGTRLLPEEFIEFLSAIEEGSELHTASGTEATKRRSADITSLFLSPAQIATRDRPDPFHDYEFLHGQNSVHLGHKQSFSDTEIDIYSGLLKERLASNGFQLGRTYKQILQGALATSETVLYRIEKKSGNSVIQNFYLPNSNDIDIHEFIDTQVKYGKQYTYNIYVWELVYGTEYRYVPYHSPSANAAVYKVNVETRPLVKLIEVPYYFGTRVVMDKPPTQPNVEIVPFRGISNKFKINLTSNTGKYDKIPVTIEPEEQDEVARLLSAQGRSSLEKLEYNSDDYADLYEIYRIDKYPEGYEDFSTNLLKTVGTGESTSASTIEKVVPNKKYWYIFRSIDIHGHRSYPSPVYEVEMVDDKGSVYMLMRSVEFKEKSTKVPSNSFKRLMHIEPALSQIALNIDNIAGFDSVAKDGRWENQNLFKLGVEDKKLWGETFIVRLTSRKTGRKVDLKVKFVKKHNAINPN